MFNRVFRTHEDAPDLQHIINKSSLQRLENLEDTQKKIIECLKIIHKEMKELNDQFENSKGD
jgi:hypothetical protein